MHAAPFETMQLSICGGFRMVDSDVCSVFNWFIRSIHFALASRFFELQIAIFMLLSAVRSWLSRFLIRNDDGQ